MLKKLDSSLFGFSEWRAGSLADLGVATKFHDIAAFRNRIRSCAIGYADGSEVPCRPKEGTVAVMMRVDTVVFWTHFLVREFELVFDN